MEELLKQLLKEVQEIKASQTRMENDHGKQFSKLHQDVSNIKGQLDETNQITRSLLHSTEELDAKFDGFLHTTASKDSIAHLETKMERIAGDVNFLVRKAAEHEDDIRNLKLIK